MQTALLTPRISPDEYLTHERTSDVRHEYVDGEVFAMVGSSLRHNEIAGNIFATLRLSARDRGCRAYMSDAKVRVELANAYYYPDVVVTCDPPANDRYVINAPSLIVEVLSDSTESIDRRSKRPHYQSIPSLRELVLVAQDERRVEVYRRTADGWLHETITSGAVMLEALGITLPLDDIYA